MKNVHRLAVLFIVVPLGCGGGPRRDSNSPGQSSDTVDTNGIPPTPAEAKSTQSAHARRSVLVGSLCQNTALGRPAVRPLVAKRGAWVADSAVLDQLVGTREARQFVVFGFEGKRSGVFSVVGRAGRGDQRVAAGSYAGGEPCARADRSVDPVCSNRQDGCGLAVSVLEPPGGFAARPFDEDPDLPSFATGGACLADGRVFVDLDADKSVESFEIAGFIDESGGLADELYSSEPRKMPCAPRFSLPITEAGGDTGAGALTIIGIVDLDADGRFEVVVTLSKGAQVAWAVYSAPGTTRRLERSPIADRRKEAP